MISYIETTEYRKKREQVVIIIRPINKQSISVVSRNLPNMEFLFFKFYYLEFLSISRRYDGNLKHLHLIFQQ